MNVFDLSAKLTLDKSSYESSLNSAKNLASSVGGAISSAFSMVAKVSGTALATGAGAVLALTKQAVGAYANYEQLAGGVETLFKNGSSKVMQYADQAYKTSGVSANKYMETVTGFSASLIQSVAKGSQQTTKVSTDAMKYALDDQLDALKDANDKQLDVIKRRQSDELDILKDEQEDALDLIKTANEKEISEYKNLTDEKIKLINKQYNENLKLIDEERYNQIKAIDDQIDALNNQTKEEQELADKAQQEKKKASLEEKVLNAETIEEREKAEQELAEYLDELDRKERKKERDRQIEALKDQKEAINEEANARKEALKEQQNAEVEAIKKQAEAELEAIRQAQEEKLKEVRRANEEEVKALKRAQEDEVNAVKEANDAKEKAMKRYVDAQKKAVGQESVAVQATAEDYEKASELADMAMRDMSDNANKMGTNIESIQNAYQGFAKGNFTMLDNLKLGYGGTKEEMVRLLREAEKLQGLELGTYDESNFADIVQAIHVIQDEMGITGTTALEAGTTIQGSIGMMKGAWGDLLTEITKPNGDIGGAIEKFVTSIVGDGTDTNKGVIGNIMPAIEKALLGMGEVFTRMAPVLAQELPKLITALLPSLIKSAGTLVSGLIKSLPEVLKALSTALKQLLTEIFDALGLDVDVDGLFELFGNVAEGITSIFKGLKDALGPVIDILVDFFNNFVKGLNALKDGVDSDEVWDSFNKMMNDTDQLIEMGTQAIQKFLEGLIEYLPKIIEFGFNALASLVSSIAGQLPTLIPLAFDLVMTLVESLIDNIDFIIDAGISLLLGLLDGIVNTIPKLVEKIPEIITHIVEALIRNIPKIVGAGIELLLGLGKGLIEALPTLALQYPILISSIVKGIVAGVDDIKDAGWDLIEGLWSGIKERWEDLVDGVKELGSNLIDSVKDLFDIHSPSRVFKYIGEMCVEGLEDGSDELFGTDGLEAKVSASVKSTAELESGSKMDMLIEMLEEYLPSLATKDSFDNIGISVNNREFGRLVNGVI